jgi:hypothetical protein
VASDRQLLVQPIRPAEGRAQDIYIFLPCRRAFQEQLFKSSFRATSFREVLLAPHSKRSSASDLFCEANTKHKVWIRRCAAGRERTSRIVQLCTHEVHRWEYRRAG